MAALRLHDVELAAWSAAQRRDADLRSQRVRRRAHGIVHTPPELARAVVTVADELLQERFALRDGVCDAGAHVIDPACGAGAFLAAVLARAERHAALDARHMHGFDLDSDALRLSRELLAHPAGARIELACVDMLDGNALCELAARTDRVLVLLGNPPWASARARPSRLAQALLEDFRCDADGTRLPERKLGVLSDAYVRFFRVCAEAARVARAGALIGLVSNASFLDGPVHRAMRAALLRWFDDLFVLDLGGSALLSRTPGARDANVFGVRPAVAVTWLCRYAQPKRRATARLHYVRMQGDKPDKLRQLGAATRSAFVWQELTPEAPLLRFVPTRRARPKYAAYWSLAESLPFNREGVQSNRDAVVIDADAQRLLARLRAFVQGRGARRVELAPALRALAHYDPRLARARVAAAIERDPQGRLGVSVQRIAYRPFDERYFCPVAPLCHRPRPELLRACADSAMVLVSVRKDRGSAHWTHAAASAQVIDNCFLSARSSCRARAFPTLTPQGADNLSPAVRDALSEQTGMPVGALSFQRYALACMTAGAYRMRWDAELRQDYARIPPPPSAAVFRELSEVGQRLHQLLVEPLAPSVPAGESATAAPPLAARFRDLVIDGARGRVLLRGEPVAQPGRAALALEIGHHRPLAAYVATRRDQPLDASGLAAVCSRAERLARLAALQPELDSVFRRAFAEADGL